MVGGVILASGLRNLAPGIAEGLSQVFERLLVRLRSGSCKVEEESNRRLAESTCETSSGNFRNPRNLLTGQTPSSNCGLGRAFGCEPNGSVPSLTARSQKCRLTQPPTTFSSARNPNELLRFYDGASWHCRHGGNVLSPQ